MEVKRKVGNQKKKFELKNKVCESKMQREMWPLRAIVLRLRPATLLRKRLWHRYFPVCVYELFNNTFFTNSGRLLLYLIFCQTYMMENHSWNSWLQTSYVSTKYKREPNGQMTETGCFLDNYMAPKMLYKRPNQAQFRACVHYDSLEKIIVSENKNFE